MTVEGFSISGLATWVNVPELGVMFDAGECPIESVPLDHVFLSHVHGDHSRCLLRHWQLRRMLRMGEATYYVPAHAVDGFRRLVAVEAEMEGVADPAEVVFPNFQTLPDDGTTRTAFKRGLWVTAFPVRHRVPSQGFTVGRTVQKLKPEYEGLPGAEIGALRKAGTVVTDAVETPLVTFIGDCVGESLTTQAHIWDSKVVIIECTYVEDADAPNAAAYGHTHLREIVEVLSRTPAPACEALVLKHFSMKVNTERVRELVAAAVPPEWANRVHVLLP
jgi:ribonuclease Z